MDAAVAKPAATPAESDPKRSRTRYWLDHGFQIRYTALLALSGLASALFFGAWMYRAHLTTTRVLAIEGALMPEVAREDQRIFFAYIGLSLVMAAVLGLVGVALTHRVAGPLHVLSMCMGAVEEGRYPFVRALRKGDELVETLGDFKRMVDTLKEREGRVATELERAIAALDEAAKSRPQHADEYRAIAAPLKAIREEKRARLAG